MIIIFYDPTRGCAKTTWWGSGEKGKNGYVRLRVEGEVSEGGGGGSGKFSGHMVFAQSLGTAKVTLSSSKW